MADFDTHPFLDHLIDYLAQLEDPSLEPVIREYDGPASPKTTSIQRSLETIARRLASQNKLLDGVHRPEELASAAAAEPSTPEPGVVEEWESVLTPEEELKQLRGQVKDVLRVCSAVRRGDFTQKVTVDVQDPLMIGLKGELNAITRTLGATMSQFIAVSNKIGLKGELGGQALVLDIEGTWREAVNVFNNMAGNLTSHLRDLMFIIKRVTQGDLSRLPDIDASGEIGEWNEYTAKLVLLLRRLTGEIRRVSQEFEKGELDSKAWVPDAEGLWGDTIRDFNRMCSTMNTHISSITSVSKAIERGDFARQSDTPAEGEMLALKESVNNISARLSYFTQEIARTTQDYGDKGYYGGQIVTRGFKGSWDTTTRRLNHMYRVWTDQFRAHAEAVRSLAAGDFSRAISVAASGEMGALNDTLNEIVGQVSLIVSETSRVAREYGVEGKLGSQARIPIKGQWVGMVDDVNIMLANLTVNIRTIELVVAAMVRGDLTMKITGISPKGEVLSLVNGVNELLDKLNQQNESTQSAPAP